MTPTLSGNEDVRDDALRAELAYVVQLLGRLTHDEQAKVYQAIQARLSQSRVFAALPEDPPLIPSQ